MGNKKSKDILGLDEPIEYYHKIFINDLLKTQTSEEELKELLNLFNIDENDLIIHNDLSAKYGKHPTKVYRKRRDFEDIYDTFDRNLVLYNDQPVIKIKYYLGGSSSDVEFRELLNFFEFMKKHSERKDIVKFVGCSFSGKRVRLADDYMLSRPSTFNLSSFPIFLYEFLKNMDVKTYITEHLNIENDPIVTSSEKRLQILYSLCTTLQFFHEEEKKVIGNLDWTHVLLDDTLQPVLFNLRRMRNLTPTPKLSYSTQKFLNPFYSAPEMSDRSEYDASADIYSFGVMMYSLITLDFEFGYDEKKRISPALFGLYEKFPPIDEKNTGFVKPEDWDKYNNDSEDEKELHKWDPKYPKWIVDLMKQCWAKDPIDRLTIHEIKLVFEENLKIIDKEQEKEGEEVFDEEIDNVVDGLFEDV